MNENECLMNVRNYNNSLPFASVQANVLKIPNRCPYCLKIQGQMYHSVGRLHPEGQNSVHNSKFRDKL